MKILKRPLLGLLLVAVSATSFAEDKLGTRDNPVKIFFTPSVDANTIATNSTSFLKFMEKETGFYFKSGIPSNYVAVVEAFGSNRADVAVMNSFGYLMANAKYGAEAKLKALRHGKDYYAGAIYVSEKSGIKSVKDLAGKKFAFTDSSSTSGYLYPLKIFKDEKVKLGNTMFAIKHDNVITMIYQGQVDAGAAFYSDAFDGKIKDARERVMTQFPDVEKKVKVLKVTEKIPNDPFVFRKGMDPAAVDKIIVALKKYLATEEGKTVFKNIYAIDGVVPATNKDYDSLRAVIKAVGVDVGTLVK
ncbi:phosphate/phosphite/phosphonate ABC transporter substrate-binding protein [Bacteriovorax sp. PP10]|uniref:Phosphate/phosphite/phosphonate ABC transporter substrate-binding protein n=1 Tax=Bacteriovorax antarcticus TaxID=3088717 RepID=A0ABU5VYH7_9BACT|nr:phosphate/phosphite/phosphonate ABC transporter substrate-binding protein [Bacteriovorax sp. PP10]MEA9358113.1 phosphate/phosphite/phosphonate ABC transporter substrate-binding protein [Bacteriovorax sp. PP10]